MVFYTRTALNCNWISFPAVMVNDFSAWNGVASNPLPTYRITDGTTASGQNKAQAASGISSTEEGGAESNAARTIQSEGQKTGTSGGIGRRVRDGEVPTAAMRQRT
jgi:hypothetical protein